VKSPTTDDGEPARSRSRVEDEVLEILARTEQPLSFRDHVRQRASRQRRARLNQVASQWWNVSAITPGMLLIGSLVIAIVAASVRDSSALLATLLAVVSIGLFACLYIKRFRSQSSSDVKRWRGQSIGGSDSTPEWLNNARRRMKRPPKF